MIDHILLAPYFLILKLRHLLYDLGIRKTHKSPIPTISLGNITVGGTGKTPHTEMLVRLLSSETKWKDHSLAVLSRGYKRKSHGFQQVVTDGTAYTFGDEPLQIKRKFPEITVAVDKDRVRGCDFLSHPEMLHTSKKARKCMNKDMPAADMVILDDAFQYRTLTPSMSILLIDYRRPITEDHLLPIGRLRDLPERMSAADAIMITKCPAYIETFEKKHILGRLRMSNYNSETCTATNQNGKTQHVFFTKVSYCQPEAVFPDGDSRYIYSKSAILVTAIADNLPLTRYLSDSYKIKKRISFPDHHRFSKSDINILEKAAAEHPTSVLITTEKDSQRFLDCKNISETLRKKLFRIPIEVKFITDTETQNFITLLNNLPQE